MNGLTAGSFVLALFALAYAVLLGTQLRAMRKKIAELEELERKLAEATNIRPPGA